MTSAFKFYKDTKSNGIKPIIGVELMFFDNDDIACQKAGGKYYPISVYVKDFEAYKALISLSSRRKEFYTTKLDDKLPLYNWKDLESLRGKNVEIAIGGHMSLPYRLKVKGNGTLIVPFIERLKGVGNLSLFISAGNEDSVWQESVIVKTNKRDVYINSDRRVDTDVAANISVKELVGSDRHKKITAIYKNHVKRTLPEPVSVNSARFERGWKKLSKNHSKESNQLFHKLGKALNIPLLVSDYAFMAEKSNKNVQVVRQEGSRIKSDYNMLSTEELTQNLSDHEIPLLDIQKAVQNTEDWSTRFNLELKFPYRLPRIEKPDAELIALFSKVGRFARFKNNPVYMNRLKLEIEVLRKNGVIDLLPYFFPIANYLDRCIEDGNLVGPARGSAGGSLLAYFMGIIQIDPIKYDLPFERFFSLFRVQTGKFPDIDCDASHKRTLFGEDGNSGWLYDTYGDKAAQVSTRTMMRLKSSIKDVNRLFNGEVDKSIEKLSEKLPAPPQGVSDADFLFGYKNSDGVIMEGAFSKDSDLQEYASSRPSEWEVVKDCLGISRQNSRHASAVIICDEPVHSIVPVMSVGESKSVTQFEAKDCEAAGLIKYDFLVVKQLEDVSGCLKLINKKNGDNFQTGYFTHEGKKTYIWELPESDEKTARLLETDSYEGLFQIGTSSMFPFVRAIKPKNIDDLAIILALVRPGPLDFTDEKTGRNMAEEYIERRYGRSSGSLEILNKTFPETYGILIFQEQISKACIQIGRMSGERAEILRDHMCKKRMKSLEEMKPEFMEGAIQEVGKETADIIWEMMVTFGNYSFNRSHSYGYAMITWATAFLKAHYPLEWWTSILSNADQKEITEKFWKHVKHLVAAPDVSISTENMVIDYKNNLIRSKMSMVKGLSDETAKKLEAARPFTSLEDFIRKNIIKPSMAKKLILVGAMDSFFDKDEPVLDKLYKYEEVSEEIRYNDAISEGKKTKKKAVKVDPELLSLSPLEMITLKKTVLPSMPINITDLVCEISPIIKKSGKNSYISHNGKIPWVLNGAMAEKVETANVNNTINFASICYVVSMKEFSFSGGTKKALKLVVDTDGYIRELVKWPNFDTGILEYPKTLKKDSVAMLVLNKRPEKDPRIDDIIVDL